MSIRTVKKLVAGIAAEASTKGTVWSKIEVYPQFPKMDDAGGKCLVVIGPIRRPERRMTMPRGAGKKELIYSVDLLLQATHDDAQEGGDSFDTLIELMCDQMRGNSPGSYLLNDKILDRQSQVTHVGENLSVETLSPEVADLQAQMTFRAVVTVEVIEVITA